MKILYLAPISYGALKQRPQFLAEQLAKQYEVYYVDPTISWMKKSPDVNGRRYDVKQQLHVVRLDGHHTGYRSLELFDLLHRNPVSECRQLEQISKTWDVVLAGYPAWYSVICKLHFSKLFYDKMDNNALITKNSLLKRLIQRVEPKLIRCSDGVFTTAQSFYEEIKKEKDNTVLLPNAVSADAFRVLPTIKEKNTNERVFGYIGTIGHWFDFSAIQTILEADQNNRVVLVGPAEEKQLSHPHLTYYGAVPHEKIPELIDSFDVCLYPFLQNELLSTIDPVKIYEYLALNKPVLAVKSRETEKFKPLVTLYTGREDLRRKSQAAFSAPFADETGRNEFIKENCWDARAAQIEQIIGG